MKLLMFSLVLLSGLNSFSGGFRWPNVNYSYAKVHLFNVDLEKEPYFDWHIYENGCYATSKIGSGYDASEEFLAKVHKTFAHGIDELRMGLGKCYMPRHGIIYYDSKGKAVAALSICFECDQISFWSERELPPTNKEASNYKKAEKQILELENIFKKFDVPVFNNRDEYTAFLATDSSNYDNGELFIDAPTLDSLYYKKYSIAEVKAWKKGRGRGASLKESEETKIAAGGKKWTYKQLTSERGDKFVFSFDKEDPFLVEATVVHGSIILPNGVSVGMSVEDVQATIGVYDGPAWPEHIQLKDKNLVLDYYFEHRSLVKINASFSIE